MNPNKDRAQTIQLYVQKSWETLEDGKILAEKKRWNSCINRLYYSCFYMVYALIIQKLDVRTKTHSGVKTLFSQHVSKPGLVSVQTATFYSFMMDKRHDIDYGDFGILTAEEVLPLISQTEEFIKTVQQLISQS